MWNAEFVRPRPRPSSSKIFQPVLTELLILEDEDDLRIVFFIRNVCRAIVRRSRTTAGRNLKSKIQKAVP